MLFRKRDLFGVWRLDYGIGIVCVGFRRERECLRSGLTVVRVAYLVPSGLEFLSILFFLCNWRRKRIWEFFEITFLKENRISFPEI